MPQLERLASLVIAENKRQNLIARSTIAEIWMRHILDSVQLIKLVSPDGLWVDIGTGGGFPGLAVAILRPDPILLVEPRKRRAAFLSDMVDTLGLMNARVSASRIEQTDVCHAAVISARAVAPIETLFAMVCPRTTQQTQWILPRGEAWRSDLAMAEKDWLGTFHVEQSLSNSAARIIVATGVSHR